MTSPALLAFALLALCATVGKAQLGKGCKCGDDCGTGFSCAQTVQAFFDADNDEFLLGVILIQAGSTPPFGSVGQLTQVCYPTDASPQTTTQQPAGRSLVPQIAVQVYLYTPDFCPICPVGTVCGDPVITGYDGRAFDFKGEPELYFNLISETNHNVNTKFVDAELLEHPGNFMGEVGFKYMNATVKAAITREGHMTVEINSEEQPFSQVTKDLGNGMLVEIEPHFPQLGHIVVITTPLMVFRIEAIKPFTDATTGFNRGYLNVLSILREHPEDMHGILGQTAYTTEYYPLNDMQFHGEGDEMDYIVSSLFAHDSKFNKFAFTGLAQPTNAARRLLVSSGPAEKRVVYSDSPLMAGHSALLKHFT